MRWIVEGPKWRLAEIGKAEARHAKCRLRHNDAEALVAERLLLAPRPAGELAETCVHGGLGARVGRREIKIAPMQLIQPIVLRRFKLMGLHARFDHLDERREQLPVQPVAIKVARRRVRRGDHHHVAREQLLEQAPQDHGVAKSVTSSSSKQSSAASFAISAAALAIGSAAALRPRSIASCALP